MSGSLTGVEQRLLGELLRFHAARSRGEVIELRSATAQRPRFRQPLRRSYAIQNLVVIGALAAVAVLLLVRATGLGTGPALAATPRPLHYNAPPPGAPTGRGVLLNLARAAARQAAPAPSPGRRYAYVKTVGWYLTLGQGAGAGHVFPQARRSWLKADGSGRMVTTTGTHTQISRLTVGSEPRLLDLSTNPRVLADELAVGHPRSDGPQEQLVAFTDTASQQPISPPAEAAILRLLARTPDLVNRGSVTDRAGRRGVAVSFDATRLGNRYTLILDPRTGGLLGFEQTLIGSAARRHVRPGAVLAYTTIINAGYVDSTTSTP
ncbi:MAG: CU044_5270 family protein [Solirubrobacteraceae bacterium]